MSKTGRQDHWLDRIGAADDAANDGPAFVPNKVVKREKLSVPEPLKDRDHFTVTPCFAIGPPTRDTDRKYRLWRQAVTNLIKKNGLLAGIGPLNIKPEMRAVESEWIANPSLYEEALEIAEWSKTQYLAGSIQRGEFVPITEEDRRRFEQLD